MTSETSEGANDRGAVKLFDRRLRGRPLRNTRCPYCGTQLDRNTRTKEHVIGRRFVPIGTLNNAWNLILWACLQCNRRKSDLEDDISAISMHFHTEGLPLMADARVQTEAHRRGMKSGSRTTGTAVANSRSSLRFRANLELGSLSGNFTAPAQFDDTRVHELARLQMMGFFYFLTYDDAKETGGYWIGDFLPVHGAIKSDWGNPIHVAFMNMTANWDYRLVLHSAQGYYKAAIRRHPDKACWSWAVEWNDCYRLIGFFGDATTAKAMVGGLPPLPMHSIHESPRECLRYRVEQPLAEGDDTLFCNGER